MTIQAAPRTGSNKKKLKLDKTIQTGQINQNAQDPITEAERSQLITQEQAKLLRDAQALMTDTIRVDAFEPENLPMMKAG